MRAQAALEMLFAVTLSLLVFFWVSNYSEGFAETNYASDIANQQRLAFKAVASSVNEVCVRGVNATIDTPCLKRKAENLYYNLSYVAGDPEYTIQNGFSNSTETAAALCGFEQGFAYLLKCDETPTLCISKAGDKVMVSQGACN